MTNRDDIQLDEDIDRLLDKGAALEQPPADVEEHVWEKLDESIGEPESGDATEQESQRGGEQTASSSGDEEGFIDFISNQLSSLGSSASKAASLKLLGGLAGIGALIGVAAAVDYDDNQTPGQQTQKLKKAVNVEKPKVRSGPSVQGKAKEETPTVHRREQTDHSTGTALPAETTDESSDKLAKRQPDREGNAPSTANSESNRGKTGDTDAAKRREATVEKQSPGKPTGQEQKKAGSPEPSGSLAAERRLLQKAQSQLETESSQALETLQRHADRFPEGQLTAERKVLRLRALDRLERNGRLRKEAQRFLEEHPNSIFRGVVSEYLE